MESMSGLLLLLSFIIAIPALNANSVHPDQTSFSAASDWAYTICQCPVSN